ncbi:SMI1/KNR4 family protein [Microcystis aeruginosa]
MNTRELSASDTIPSKKLARWGAEANSPERMGICQSFPLPLVLGGKAMKSATLLSRDRPLPEFLWSAIRERFPGKAIDDLSIRYYESVEDVGWEYFNERVLPACSDEPVVRYLSPFISYVRLGEALVLDRQDGLVVYDTDRDVPCTETGPFWWVTPKSR